MPVEHRWFVVQLSWCCSPEQPAATPGHATSWSLPLRTQGPRERSRVLALPHAALSTCLCCRAADEQATLLRSLAAGEANGDGTHHQAPTELASEGAEAAARDGSATASTSGLDHGRPPANASLHHQALA